MPFPFHSAVRKKIFWRSWAKLYKLQYIYYNFPCKKIRVTFSQDSHGTCDIHFLQSTAFLPHHDSNCPCQFSWAWQGPWRMTLTPSRLPACMWLWLYPSPPCSARVLPLNSTPSLACVFRASCHHLNLPEGWKQEFPFTGETSEVAGNARI